jgi:hypothetical protein
MIDFKLIAKRMIVTEKNGIVKKDSVERFIPLSDILNRETETMIMYSAVPLKAYIEALEVQAENFGFNDLIYNNQNQIIGIQRSYPQKKLFDEVVEQICEFIKGGWTVRLVY